MKIAEMREFTRQFGMSGFKTYRGHEGEVLRQGNLLVDEKKAGFISDGDWGGPPTYEIDKQHMKIINIYITKQPPIQGNEYDIESFIDDVLTAHEVVRKIDKLKKNGAICFVLPDDEDDTYRTLKCGSVEKIGEGVKHLREKYPDLVFC
jgi:hypothetical protein